MPLTSKYIWIYDDDKNMLYSKSYMYLYKVLTEKIRCMEVEHS